MVDGNEYVFENIGQALDYVLHQEQNDFNFNKVFSEVEDIPSFGRYSETLLRPISGVL